MAAVRKILTGVALVMLSALVLNSGMLWANSLSVILLLGGMIMVAYGVMSSD